MPRLVCTGVGPAGAPPTLAHRRPRALHPQPGRPTVLHPEPLAEGLRSPGHGRPRPHVRPMACGSAAMGGHVAEAGVDSRCRPWVRPGGLGGAHVHRWGRRRPRGCAADSGCVLQEDARVPNGLALRPGSGCSPHVLWPVHASSRIAGDRGARWGRASARWRVVAGRGCPQHGERGGCGKCATGPSRLGCRPMGRSAGFSRCC
mmetsp:Transcript_56731/g.101161  ORF Transcript_56731/g.101161 Transcript_56731/m.101161 type:complete len:203 (-) Transcript_56731:663-1271(-)